MQRWEGRVQVVRTREGPLPAKCQWLCATAGAGRVRQDQGEDLVLAAPGPPVEGRPHGRAGLERVCSGVGSLMRCCQGRRWRPFKMRA